MSSKIDTVDICGVEVFAERYSLARKCSADDEQSRWLWLGEYRLTPVVFILEREAKIKAAELTEQEHSPWLARKVAVLDIYFVCRANLLGGMSIHMPGERALDAFRLRVFEDAAAQ